MPFTRRRHWPWSSGALIATLALAACPFDPASPSRCMGDENCPRGYTCVDGFCAKDPLPPTADAARSDGTTVELDGAGPDVGDDASGADSASTTDATAAPDAVARPDAPVDDTDRPVDAAAPDRWSLDRAAPESGAGEAGPGDGPIVDHDAAVVDTGPLCNPSTCPASTEPCLLPTCGPTGCTFTVATENTACPGGVCRSGQCTDLCWIDGATVQPGARQVPGGCQACQPDLDPLAFSALPDQDPCDDGLWCTGGDRCSGGICAVSDFSGDGRCGGGTPRCDEANDRCVQCTIAAHCLGTPGAPHCRLDTGTCVACLSPSDCPDDGNACTDTTCSGNVCGHAANAASCNDNLWCNGADTCSSSACSLHTYTGNQRCGSPTPYCDEANDRCVQCLSVANCPDDANVCTTKICTDGTCGQSNNTVSCDDTLWCNGTDTCGGGQCQHQYVNRCSSVTYRTTCNELLDRCECNDTSCPMGWTCHGVTKRCRRTETFSLTDDNQDGYQDPYNAATVLGVGELYLYMSLYSHDHVGGLRYRLLNVPVGASIVSAYLTVYVNKTESTLDSPDLDISAWRVANATAMIGNVANELTSKPLTTASVRWLASPLGVGWRNSPDLVTVIQELVQLPTWSAANYVLLILRPRQNTNFEFLQREGGQPATLTVVHELP